MTLALRLDGPAWRLQTLYRRFMVEQSASGKLRARQPAPVVPVHAIPTLSQRRLSGARLPAKALLLAGVVGTVAALTLSAPASAAAQKVCWKQVIQDWAIDGRIDGTYPPACINKAISHLGPDVVEYSSFQDEAKRALAADERWLRAHPKRKAQYTYGVAGRKHGGNSGPAPLHGGNGGSSSGGAAATASGFGGKGPLTHVLDSGTSSDPTSVPIPLIVLGGLAVLLMLAAGASFLARRIQTHRNQP
jgi:hypothetical protein